MILDVLDNFEVELFGKKHLFFAASSPKKLVVVFNGATRNRYSMWSYFYNEKHNWNDTSYLFLKEGDDPDYFWWYLKDEEAYGNIIEHYISSQGLNPKDVVTMGSSMGGYASMYFGLKLKVQGCIGFRPQIDYLSASQFFTIGRLKDLWVDLDCLIDQCSEDQLPMMYLNYSDFAHDKLAAYHWIDSLKKKKTLSIIHPVSGPDHVSWNPDKEFVQNVIDFMYSIKRSW